jgi:hypothetical protein
MKEGTYKEMKQNKAADQKKNEKKETMTEDVERAGKSLIKVKKEVKQQIYSNSGWNGMEWIY